MSRTMGSIKTDNYQDKEGNPLIVAGSNIEVIEGVSGNYIISGEKSASFTVNTDPNGNATVNISTYGFTAIPVVQVSCIATSSIELTACNIVSVSTTTLRLKTYVTNRQKKIEPVSTTVHVSLFNPS